MWCLRCGAYGEKVVRGLVRRCRGVATRTGKWVIGKFGKNVHPIDGRKPRRPFPYLPLGTREEEGDGGRHGEDGGITGSIDETVHTLQRGTGQRPPWEEGGRVLEAEVRWEEGSDAPSMEPSLSQEVRVERHSEEVDVKAGNDVKRKRSGSPGCDGRSRRTAVGGTYGQGPDDWGVGTGKRGDGRKKRMGCGLRGATPNGRGAGGRKYRGPTG